MSQVLVEGIRNRLREIEAERKHLLALQSLYEGRGGAGYADAPWQREPEPQTPLFDSASATSPVIGNGGNGGLTAAGLLSGQGGPTERILYVVQHHPGLTYSEVIDKALPGMMTTSENPERSLGSTLQSLVTRGRIELRDKRHYLAR